MNWQAFYAIWSRRLTDGTIGRGWLMRCRIGKGWQYRRMTPDEEYQHERDEAW